MQYIPVDLYRGSYGDYINSSLMQNPNTLSVVGDSYANAGEDLHIGSKSLTSQKFIYESPEGEQSVVIFDNVENPKATSPQSDKGFIVTGYRRDEATGDRLFRVRNILESDLPEDYERINVKVLNASYIDVSILKNTSIGVIKTLEIQDPSFKLGYKKTGYIFDSSYFLDCSSYTNINYKPYIKSERSDRFMGDQSPLHRGSAIENLTHALPDNAFNKGNFGFKSFHEYWLTALDSSMGFSPDPDNFTDYAENPMSDDFEVMLEKDVYMGDYCNEMKIVANNNTVYKVLKTLLQKRVPPVYVGPTHGASGSGFGTYEVGTRVTMKINTSYTNPTPRELGATKENGYVTSRFDSLTSKYNLDTRHGGNLLSSVITKSGNTSLLANYTEGPLEYEGLIKDYTASGIIGKGSMSWKVTATTETGPILKDNFLEFNAIDDHTAETEEGFNKAKGFYSTVEAYGYNADASKIVMPDYETKGAHGAYSVGALNNHNNTFTQTFSVEGRYKYYVCSSTSLYTSGMWDKASILTKSNIIKNGLLPNSNNGSQALGKVTFPRGAKQFIVATPSFFTNKTLTDIKNELGADEKESFVYMGTIKCGGIQGNDNYLIDYDLFVNRIDAGTSADVIYSTFTL
mgnify:CR=1 FL=1